MDRPTKREVWEALIVVPAALAVAVFSFAALPLRLALVSCLLGWAMLAIAVIDARRFIIPDVLSLPAIPIGLLASGRLLEPSADGLVRIDHVIGMLAGGLGRGSCARSTFAFAGARDWASATSSSRPLPAPGSAGRACPMSSCWRRRWR